MASYPRVLRGVLAPVLGSALAALAVVGLAAACGEVVGALLELASPGGGALGLGLRSAGTGSAFTAWLARRVAEAGSQREAARRIGVNHATLGMLLGGQTRPTLDTLRKIARWSEGSKEPRTVEELERVAPVAVRRIDAEEREELADAIARRVWQFMRAGFKETALGYVWAQAVRRTGQGGTEPPPGEPPTERVAVPDAYAEHRFAVFRLEGRPPAPYQPGDEVYVDLERRWADGDVVAVLRAGAVDVRVVERAGGRLVLRGRFGEADRPTEAAVLGVVFRLARPPPAIDARGR